MHWRGDRGDAERSQRTLLEGRRLLFPPQLPTLLKITAGRGDGVDVKVLADALCLFVKTGIVQPVSQIDDISVIERTRGRGGRLPR